ncbi:MAG: hypothetical protein FWD02_04495 [Bacteroidales bacterium]|nr:hypothetical protein [Bacteroidales bacterium]
MANLQITGFRLTDLFGIDCGNIASKSCNINSFRGVEDFLGKVKTKMLNPESYGFTKPIYDESEYSKTDRVSRHTFSNYFAYNLMPLFFASINPTQYKVKDLVFNFQGIRISPKMSITINISCNLDNSKSNVQDLINNYSDYKKTVKEKLYDYMNSFIDCWNAHVKELSFEKIPESEFDMFLHQYEIIDFDYSVYNGNKKTTFKIKDILKSGDYDLIKQLAGFTRMSYNYNSYDIEKLDNFFSTNFGNRDDELWIVNKERFIRHHPEAKTNKYNIAFFSDAKLVFEILLQQETCLKYLNIWINKNRNDFSNKLVKLAQDKNKRKNDEIESFLGDIARLSDIFSDKYLIQRDINHSFFNEVFIRAIDVLRIENLMAITKESYQIHSLYTSQKISNYSLNLNKKMKHLTIWMIILGVLTFLLAAVTTVKTLSDSKFKNDNVNNEVQIDSESENNGTLRQIKKLKF